MKRVTFCIILFLGFAMISYGQEESVDFNKRGAHHQIGANVGLLVKGLLGKDDNNQSLLINSNEVFTLKTGRNNISFRAGFGFNFERQNDDNGGESLKQSAYSFRVGFEKLNPISYRWQYYAGLDMKYARNNIEFDSNFFLGPSKFRSYALTPLLGIQFRLTDKLVLQTEASISFFYSEIENPVFIDSFPVLPPEPNFSDEGKNKGAFITIPRTLYLVLDL